MQVKKYFYKTADFFNKDKKARYISETLGNRNSYMNEVFYKLYKKEIESLKTTGNTALLYIAGACEHHSASRDCIQVLKGAMPVKSQLGYIASKTAKRMGNISYLSINANACASSLYALKEAKELLNQGFDDVLIYGEEWVEEVELMLFKQLNIDLVCSDGFFILQLTNNCNNPIATIENVNWIWNNDKSPFEVTKEGYINSMLPFKDKQIDLIKMHGSGTAQNDKAELEAINELFENIARIEYKSQIGHSQGVSTGVELCKLLEEQKDKSVLVNASGLGNFYGSCYVRL
ncbi:hypothetical protein [Halarcobacter anaerophilus]|nr:hypothetical protein [Halarcobacter anaerophilus]QDF28992.1 hypothetical protein AANAER_1512 [Halarcobacter anaerophilus]